MRDFGRKGSAASLLVLLGASFVYGILHAAGPGHRKTVVFSIFLGKKAAPWEPAALGFLSAGVHAATGMAIVLVLSAARGAVAGLGVPSASVHLDAATSPPSLIAAALIAAKVLVRRASAPPARLGGGRKGRQREWLRASASSSSRARALPGSDDDPPLSRCTPSFCGWGPRGPRHVGGHGPSCRRPGISPMRAGPGSSAGSRRKKRPFAAPDALELVSYAILLGFAAYMLWPMLTAIL